MTGETDDSCSPTTPSQAPELEAENTFLRPPHGRAGLEGNRALTDTQAAQEEARQVSHDDVSIAADHTREIIADRADLASAETLNEKLRQANAELIRSSMALAESESRCRVIVESVTDYAIITTDRDGRITSWNQGTRNVLGWDEAEVLWRDARMIWTPEDRAAGVPEAEMHTALAHGTASDERWHLRQDGSRFWAQGQMTPLQDNGHLRGYLKILRDRSEQRTTQEALRESEARFRLVADLVPDLLWSNDPTGYTTWHNRRWQDYTGQSLERSRGHGWLDAIHADDRKFSLAKLQDALDRGELLRQEIRIRDASTGACRWFLVQALPLHDASGAIVQWFGSATDVHEQRTALEALGRSEARLRTLSETIPQLVWTSLADGMWDWAGPQWQAYTGLNEAVSLGLGWLDAVHPDDQAHVRAAWREATEAGHSGGLDVEYRIRRNDGAWRCFQTRAVPLPTDNDHEEGADRVAGLRWFGTCTDIDDIVQAREELARGRDELERQVVERTVELRHALDALHGEALEREQVETALRQAQKMEAVGQLTGGIAHDFNNMLQGIGGALEMMQRRVEQGRAAETGHYVTSALKTVERAGALTHRLLAFARRQALQPKPVVLDMLAESMAELIRRTVGPAITVELQMGDSSWSVLCDPNQLENALLNLAINARDAMLEGGHLVVFTRDVNLSAADVAGQEGARPGEYVEVAVVDTGIGIPSQVLARVFEPFFTTKPMGQGTGLGLSQVYGFMRQSSGVVRLESVPGRGTTVRLCLPRHARISMGEAAEPNKADALQAGVGEAVLLVEDEADVRALAAEALRELGYRVLEAADGPAALRLLGGNIRVDLLVSDVGLPGGLNGRQVADAARETRPDLPVLFITGYAGGAVEGALPAGMTVIGKPFALDVLAATVRNMIEGKRPA